MDKSADQYVQTPAGRRISRKSRQVAKVEHKRQADLQDGGIDNGGGGPGPGGDAKGKGSEAKGKGKAGPATPGPPGSPPGNPPAQPPGPPQGPAPPQVPGPPPAPAAPTLAPPPPGPPVPPPSPPTLQQPPPQPTTEQQPPPPSTVQPPPPPPSTVQQPPPPAASAQQPPPVVTFQPPPPPSSSPPPPPPPPPPPSSSEPPPPPAETSSSPPPPPPPSALPVLTTTSLVISTTLAVDSSTSIQTSFITITQSTVFKQESIVTPPAPIKPLPSVLEPSFYDTTVSDLTTSSPTSTGPPQSPTFGPSSPTDGAGNTRQTVLADGVISPTAKHLLLALGVLGAVSLFVTAAIILMRRSRRKIIYRVDGRSPTPELPFLGRDQNFHGVTTEITAAPRALSFHERSRSEIVPVAQPRLSIMKQGDAMSGAMSVPNNPSLPQPSEGRTFSDALNSFMEKARNSSYSYKVGP